VRIMLTGHPDLRTAIDAVNHGNIFRFLTKPCAPQDLSAALEAGLEQHRLMQTRQEHLQMKLRHAQKMEIVGQCAAGAVHDLRNILSIIQCSAHMALEQPGHPRLSTFLHQIQDAASNAANLLTQLLTFCRGREQVEPRPVDLGPLLAQLKSLLRPILPRQIELDWPEAATCPPVHGDAGMITQVLLNLAMNARDAMPRGGRLGLQVDPIELDWQSAQRHPSARPGRFVCLTLQDTGSGISPEVQAHLFEPFFTTKAESGGSGLGLAVVADIVNKHQGWIEVESRLRHGSTFRVFLPVAPSSASSRPPQGACHEQQEADSVCR